MTNGIGQNIALALQGAGAGILGNGPQFLHAMDQRRQALSEERKQALIEDAFNVHNDLTMGNVGDARNLLVNRLDAIRQLGGDPSDTLGLLTKIDSGDIEGARSDLGKVLQFAQATGRLKTPESSGLITKIEGGQVIQVDPVTGQAHAQDIQGFRQEAGVADTAGIQNFRFFTDGLSDSEIERARKVELGLLPRATTPRASPAEEFARAFAASQGQIQGKSESQRGQDAIQIGLDAVRGLPVLRRSINLLNTVKTGGIDAFKMRAKELFGVEGADPGELSANLGRAVLSQLRSIFGPQFTENDRKSFERIEAGFGKSTDTNKRLLNQLLAIVTNKANIALEASPDERTRQELVDYLEGRFDLSDEQVSEMFNKTSIKFLGFE